MWWEYVKWSLVHLRQRAWEVETNKACLRAGGRPGDFIYVSGPLGSAAACVRLNDLIPADSYNLSPRQEAFYRPSARFDMSKYLKTASSAIDISDGLVQDLNHILESSRCGASLESKLIPLGDSLSSRMDFLVGMTMS